MGSYSLVIHKGDPYLIINVTVRNDYTPKDSGNSFNPVAPIGNLTSDYRSFIVLKVSLYGENGSAINALDFVLPKSPAEVYHWTRERYQFSLKSGETTSFDITLAAANPDVDHYEINVAYLYYIPEP